LIQGSSETAALAKEQAREREKKIIATAQSNIDELQQQVAALETEKSELVDQTKAYVAKVREQNDVKTKDMVQKVMNRVYEVVASEVEKKPQVAFLDSLTFQPKKLIF
jgi:signal transduction histidine kinase